MFIIKRVVWVLAIFILVACVPAQTVAPTEIPTQTATVQNIVGEIQGRITNQQTDAPVPFMFVQARNNEGVVISVLSNQNGEYKISDLPVDTYLISAHGFGYEKSRTEIIEIDTLSPLQLDFELIHAKDTALQVSGAEWLSLLPDDDETR